MDLKYDFEKFVSACCGELQKVDMDKVLAALSELPKKEIETNLIRAYSQRCKFYPKRKKKND